MDDRHLTLIVVPHGDLETRTFQLSYRVLRVLFGLFVVAFLGFSVFLAFLFPIMAQAARVQGLERELKTLEADRARVAELAQTLAEVEAQYEKVRQMLGADAPVNGEPPSLPPLRAEPAPGTSEEPPMQQSSAELLWPLRTRGFITRTAASGDHPGLDIAAPLHSEVQAAGPGRVLEAGNDAVYGRYVLVDHGGALHTLYAHAARVTVKKGERVDAGQVIALSGSTGRSTGPHLHFEVRRDGVPVDPQELVKVP